MKIVLTGGPSAGKTTIAEALVRAYWDKVCLVPESASLLFRGGFPRDLSPLSVICQQRAIYHVQNELEQAMQIQNPEKVLICDRGTLDGLAFWPLTETEFFSQVGSSKEAEFSRYDWIIHLQTATSESYAKSAVRRETFAEAKEIDRKLELVWSSHPRWIMQPNHIDFSLKITRVMLAVKSILDGADELQVRAQLAGS